MSISLKIKKGLDLRLAGGLPQDARRSSIFPQMVAVCPDDFPGLVLKPEVKEGMTVTCGSPIFHDKKEERIKVVSPVTGKVKAIVRGERRKILRLEIEDVDVFAQGAKKFDIGIVKKSDDAKALLAESGLWAFMRQLPYGIVPRFNVEPRDIFIQGFDSAPFALDFTRELSERKEEVNLGIYLLSKLTKGKIYFSQNADKPYPYAVEGTEIVNISGPHPAGNVGVMINNVAPVNKGEVVWTLDAITVARIGRLVKTGCVDFMTTVTIAGSEIKEPQIATTPMGSNLNSVLHGCIADSECHKRIIAGNVLTGVKEGLDGYLRYPYRQVTVIPEGDDVEEFMGWASVSPSKMSVSTSFPGHFLSRFFKPDARLNGGRRAMIMSGEYDSVMPMDILPEYLIKAVLSRNIDQMEALGIYEVVPEDFALAEYVDTSKLELQKIIAEGLEYLRNELE